MGNYTIFQMFENPRRGREARNFTTNVPKILDLKSSFEQIFSENWRWVPLTFSVDTLLNFPMPFNIILTYTNTSRVNAFRRLLALFLCNFCKNQLFTYPSSDSCQSFSLSWRCVWILLWIVLCVDTRRNCFSVGNICLSKKIHFLAVLC